MPEAVAGANNAAAVLGDMGFHITRVLNIDELRELTSEDFSDILFCHEVDDTLDADFEVFQRVSRYFDFFGLRLPPHANAQTVIDTCHHLRFQYGQAVRLMALNQRERLAEHCGELTMLQLQYAEAVAAQSRARARKLAQRVFAGAEWSPYWAS